MATFVLTTIGSYGDVFPYVAIGLALRRRGHHAVIATAESYRATVEQAGLAFAAVRPDVDYEDSDAFRRAMDPKRGTEYVVRELLVPRLRDSYQDLASACEGADLLVSHTLTYAAPILGEKEGLPWVSTVLSPMNFCSAHDPPALAPAPWLAGLRRFGPGPVGAFLRLLRKLSWSWSEPIRSFRRELGLPADADPLWEGQFSPHGVLALFSPEYAQPQPDWPTPTTACGFPFHDTDFGGDGDAERLGSFLAEGSAPIVFSLGSSAAQASGDFYQLAAACVEPLARRAILVLGDSDPPPDLSTDVLAIRSAPLHRLFRSASIVVHAGGVGTTALALQAGCPQLVVPFSHDQFDNAVRVKRLGLGTSMPRGRLTAARLTRCLRTLGADDEISAAAAAMARKIQSENGTEIACDLLEAAAAHGK
jgi:UDP:flavonoid glycosyltransferase YjiC (YdhE family)